MSEFLIINNFDITDSVGHPVEINEECDGIVHVRRTYMLWYGLDPSTESYIEGWRVPRRM